ncbi:MAG TPA: response regulator transcription factor [Actinomycetota bacterium]|nr:response regulator transcription factor [Actinomycetota bacterium]
MKVLLVDDDTLVRKGLAQLLITCVEGAEVTEASDTTDALEVLEHNGHDVVVADIRLPGRDGLELLKEIRTSHPSLPVIMLTGYDDPDYVKSALAQGAAGYLLKDSTPEDLTQAIRVAMTGSGNVLSPRAVRNLFDRSSRPDHFGHTPSERGDPGLTRREIDILRYLSQGYSNREISKALFLSEKTVKAHLAAVFRKLGVSNRTKAAMAAVAMGITGPENDESGPTNGHSTAGAQAAVR